MKGLRVIARRCALRVGYRAMRVYWRLVRPHTHGVKCVIRRRDEILLVRHTYGNRSIWRLPGGTVKRREQPAVAARRELREELGIEPDDLRPLMTLEERIDSKRDTVHFFELTGATGDLTVDEGEIAEVRWFATDALPRPLERLVRRVFERKQKGGGQAASLLDDSD